MWLARAITIAVSATVVSACVPLHITDAPYIDGRVVDASTGGAIAGARLSYRDFGAVVTTDVDGGFKLGPVQRWGLVILASDVFTPARTIDIDAIGYKPRQVTVFGSHHAYTIRLDPEST